MVGTCVAAAPHAIGLWENMPGDFRALQLLGVILWDKDEDIATILLDIISTSFCLISSDPFPVGSVQLVHTIDSQNLQN